MLMLLRRAGISDCNIKLHFETNDFVWDNFKRTIYLFIQEPSVFGDFLSDVMLNALTPIIEFQLFT